MKNCKNCNTEFTPKHETRGHEQLYCSLKCRSEAYKKRLNEKNEIKQPVIIENFGNMEKQDDRFLRIQSHSNYDFYSLIERLGEAKNEAFRYQLKAEKLDEENIQLRQKNMELESEIDEYINEDEGEKGFIGGIHQSILGELLKIPAVQDFITSILKKPSNAQTTTTA